MNRQGRILVVDDKPRWRDLLQETLESGGYMVDTAATLAEARRRLSDSFYHLLVLDIRLEDDDEANAEGMDLLRSVDDFGGVDAVKVIMLSAFGTREQMREAFRDRRVEDFLTKEDFDDIDFLKQVHEIFTDKMQINLGLAINWQKSAGPEQMMLNKRYGETRISRDLPAEMLQTAAAELDDLLCRLFYKDESLLVQPLTTGRSDAGVLLTERFDAYGSTPPVVLKFDGAKPIRQEYANFKQYIEGRIGGGRTTSVIGAPRYTPRLGGVVYSMLGAAGERFESFESFYRRAETAQIKTVLQRLFFDTCKTWYDNPGVRRVHNLTEEYLKTLGFTVERIEQAIEERFKGVQGKQRLQFRALHTDQQFTNPLTFLAQPPLLRSTFVCTTHGDLHAQNILVDTDLHPWLIDFFRTGPGHILRDVVLLDAAVRIQLTAADRVSLEDRWAMERTLWGITRFSDLDRLSSTLEDVTPEIRKAYEISLYLRQIARQITLRSDDFSEYSIASCYCALNLTRFYALPMVQREHALLSASLIADQITQ